MTKVSVFGEKTADEMEDNVQILVDADACPVKEIIVRLARQYGIPVTIQIS